LIENNAKVIVKGVLKYWKDGKNAFDNGHEIVIVTN
jgi:hypothetical protein